MIRSQSLFIVFLSILFFAGNSMSFAMNMDNCKDCVKKKDLPCSDMAGMSMGKMHAKHHGTTGCKQVQLCCANEGAFSSAAYTSKAAKVKSSAVKNFNATVFPQRKKAKFELIRPPPLAVASHPIYSLNCSFLI